MPVTRRTLASLPVLFTLLALAACQKHAPTEQPVRNVRTVIAQGATLQNNREYAADIRARVETRLSFRVGGKLVSRDVDLGDSIKAGNVIGRLDAKDLRLGQQAAEAGVEAARTNLNQLEADLTRYRSLREQGFIGAAELDRREAAVKSARAQLQQAQAQSGVQDNQAGYATLRATEPGVVTAVMAEPGQVLAAGSPVVQVAHDGPRDAVFNVPEDSIERFRALVGQSNALKLRIWGEKTERPATVREVAAAADAATRTFLVKADAGSAGLRIGQTATVVVPSRPMDDRIHLPLTAVFESGGNSAVWVLDGSSMTVHRRPVTVGGAAGNEVIIASGVQPGDEIVTAGTHVLAEGQKVGRYESAAAASAGGGAKASATAPSAGSSAAERP